LACLHLYLSQKLEEIKDTTEREAFLDAVAHGSPAAWRHFNLLGEYDFSEEATGRHGNSAPKIDELNGALFWGCSEDRKPNL
jgi:hypothetical protein